MPKFVNPPSARPTASTSRLRTASRPASAVPSADALPLPEVTEGNQESDWALWEDSVAFQDSQLPSAFDERQAVKVREEPRHEAPPDPYARVPKRD